MESRPVARAVLVALLATAYAAVAWYVAGTGVAELLPPLSRAATVAVPFAAGVILACAMARPSGLLIVLASWLPMALAGAAAVSAGWLPLPWFASAGVMLVGASLAGGLGGRLIADQQRRVAAAAMVALSPVLVATYEPDVATAAAPATAAMSVVVQAPASEVWQELIDTVGRAPRERVSEWDDAEHLRVVAMVPSMEAPRGLAAWRAPRAAAGVVSSGATFDLSPMGDTATTLSMRRSYAMPIHASAYPASMLAEAANAQARAELHALNVRSVERAKASQPRLTAEMRVLRAAALRDLQEVYARHAELFGQAVLFINGARAVELPEALPAPEPLDASRAAGTLRTFLRPAANRARTTAWMHTGLGVGDSTAMPRADTLRFEFEDFEGRCVAEATPIAFAADASSLTLGTPQRARCVQTVMDDRTRRSRLIAQLPIAAGRIEDNWSVALAATGSVRVYRDSVVVRADTVKLKAKPLDGAPQTVDSIVVGLSLGGERSWSVVRRSPAVHLALTLADQRQWMRTRLRFAIPIDAEFPLERSWPSFEVVLRTPKTTDNPYGVAWTYAHAPMAFFSGVRR